MSGQTPIDEDLLRAFLSGNDEALAALAARYERSMLGLARGLLGGDGALACDAVQETWLRVIRYGGRFAGRSGVKTWMYRILVNHCRDLRRRRRGAVSEQAPEAEGRGDPRPELAFDEHDAVRAAVEALPPPQREVIVLCYHDGITCELASQLLQIPLGTVKSRLHAALSTLRARLSQKAGT